MVLATSRSTRVRGQVSSNEVSGSSLCRIVVEVSDRRTSIDLSCRAETFRNFHGRKSCDHLMPVPKWLHTFRKLLSKSRRHRRTLPNPKPRHVFPFPVSSSSMFSSCKIIFEAAGLLHSRLCFGDRVLPGFILFPVRARVSFTLKHLKRSNLR